MRLVRHLMVGAFALAVAACGDDSSSSGTPAGGDTAGGGGDTATGGTTFPAGKFTFTNTEVDDQCTDGALNVVFMPEGTAHVWQGADGKAIENEVPAWSDLPKTYQITLPAPFQPMTITVEQNGEGKMKIADATQQDVPVDETSFPGCTADMTIDADITVAGQDALTMSATLTASDWQGDKCPSQAADGCTIKLTVTGARVP